ncbi:LysR substrate-binding domain-containing protein [Spiribacter halobius]|uniref:LysR substrate-binding domain-containing protein n=1 Tax=Sediminicurvatus halobius TaxID=2182432 RepID=UPI0013047CA3|nr:LysR substrate-binding domain-containing protein [Spiribacter halobius]UEX77682.1 LysR family transcriptional regulator [Spiribacter halobius]
MSRRLPPLNALRLFEAAARLESFKNAAEELAVTPSAVSHGIQSLEDWLGVPLFLRTSRGLVLSDAGREYYPRVAHSLEVLASGADGLRTRGGAKRLRVTVAPTFAKLWLFPRLSEFLDQHPGLDLVVDTQPQRRELDSEAVDVAVRMGRGGWQGVHAQQLFNEVLVPVGAPRVVDRARESGGLDGETLISVSRAREEWASWARGAGRPYPEARRHIEVDSVDLALQAARAGAGIAMGRRPLINGDLERGTLVIAAGPPVTGQTAYWVVVSDTRSSDEAVEAFRGWLLRTATASSEH